MEDGVWRTVGGRRIFIKEGQDLSSAMKESGKFKNKKKKSEEDKMKEKYMKISEEDRVKAYEEGKNWKDLVKERESSDRIQSKNFRMYEREYGNDLDSLKRDLMLEERFLDEDARGYETAKRRIEDGYKYIEQKKSRK